MNAVAAGLSAAPSLLPRVSLPAIVGVALAGLVVSTLSFGDAPTPDAVEDSSTAAGAAVQPTVRIVKHAHRATPVLVMSPQKG